MPELPEIETIVRGLKKLIIGQKISAVIVMENSTIQFKNTLITDTILEHQISSINRRGKVMIWNLDNNQSLLFHLKMTGQIIYEKNRNRKYKPNANHVILNAEKLSRFAGGHPTKSMEGTLPDKSTRVVFNFSDGSRVYFNDQRKFGWIKLLPLSEINNEKFISSIGPEYYDPVFTSEYLAKKLKARKTSIKSMLLNQNVVAGIGNIYADESLHLSKIHPARIAGSLSKSEINLLVTSIKKVLEEGLRRGGTSFSNYVNVEGGKGDYLQYARVFRRQGKKCLVCGRVIEKIKLNGRGTHFCPNCQKYYRKKL